MNAYTNAPEGVLRFSLDIVVDMQEMKLWTPECIDAFMRGLAQAAAARHAGRLLARERAIPVETPEGTA